MHLGTSIIILKGSYQFCRMIIFKIKRIRKFDASRSDRYTLHDLFSHSFVLSFELSYETLTYDDYTNLFYSS